MKESDSEPGWWTMFQKTRTMAVVLEYGGGGANAAPVMRAVLDAWFE